MFFVMINYFEEYIKFFLKNVTKKDFDYLRRKEA